MSRVGRASPAVRYGPAKWLSRLLGSDALGHGTSRLASSERLGIHLVVGDFNRSGGRLPGLPAISSSRKELSVTVVDILIPPN